MSQSKLESKIETVANTGVGWTINFFANIWIMPLFYGAVAKDIGKAFWIGVIFTVISLVRGYLLRRLFNHYGGGGWVKLYQSIRYRNDPYAQSWILAKSLRDKYSRKK